MFGFETQSKGWEGFLDSNRKIPICIASGEGTYGSSNGKGRNGTDSYDDSVNMGGWYTTNGITLNKHVPMTMITYFGPHNFWRLAVGITAYFWDSNGMYVRFFSGPPTGAVDPDPAWSVIHEDSNIVRFSNMQVWLKGTKSHPYTTPGGKFRVMFFAQLPDNLPLPAYGFQMKDSRGNTTYNSDYMPLLIRGMSDIPNFNPNDAANPTPASLPSGVDLSRSPASPMYINGGSGYQVGGYAPTGTFIAFSGMHRGCCHFISSYFHHADSPRWQNPYKNHPPNVKIPIIHSDDYF